jgi:hypothetical protein
MPLPLCPCGAPSTVFVPGAEAVTLAACPAGPPGEPPRAVHARLGRWSVVSVRRALFDLVRAGRVAFDGEPGERRYWRGVP